MQTIKELLSCYHEQEEALDEEASEIFILRNSKAKEK
jgi:hypothetical protein